MCASKSVTSRRKSSFPVRTADALEMCNIAQVFHVHVHVHADVFEFAEQRLRGNVSIVVNNCSILHEFDWKNCLDVNIVRMTSHLIKVLVNFVT